MRITYLVIVTVDEALYNAEDYPEPPQMVAEEIESNLRSLDSDCGVVGVQVINLTVDKGKAI